MQILSRMPQNVHVPKLLQFRHIVSHRRSSICTHVPLATPPSPLCRVFANMDKGGRLSPMRHAASRWNTLSNSKIKSIQCRVGNDGIHHHPRISFYCFHSLARRPTGQFFSFTHTPVKICSTLCGFTRKLCMSSSTVGVLVDCSRDSRPAFIHSDGRGGKDSLGDSLILLLGLSAAFLSVLWSSHRTTAPLTPSGILYTNLGLSWLRLSTPRSFVLPLPHHGHHRPSVTRSHCFM